MNIRNVAIIAHVDHGKTTLVDKLLMQCRVFRENQEIRECFLDSGDLERERGITILAKNIAISYRDTRINLIDTPGHADFGGEVERVLKMADGVLLLVDSFEGAMPQTRFVLQKALELELVPIVVINKMDRPNRRPSEVLDEVYDLFIDLNANDEQLEFPVLYASGRNGWASASPADDGADLSPLLDAILERIPPPEYREGPLQMQVSTIAYSEYVGRIAIGRVFRGYIEQNDQVVLLGRDGSSQKSTVRELYTFEGLGRTRVERADCGDICAIVGLEGVEIGDTVADAESPEPLPLIRVDGPTMSMLFLANNSPFYGEEGRYVTGRHLRERLLRETESNVALRMEEAPGTEGFKVYGRGILHLSILIENMRREGYEFQVGQPRVIFKEIDGQKSEPVETLIVDVPSESAGKAIEAVSKKRGELRRMDTLGGRQRLEFSIPSRGLIGLRTRLLNLSAGEAVMHHRFHQYEPFKGPIPHRTNGVLISMQDGEAVSYALDGLQSRGRFFIGPGERVYEGQVVGENNREGDLVLNVQKTKKLTNMRAAGSEDAIRLVPPVRFSLEEALEFINEDELVEITPRSMRMRKTILDENRRKKDENLRRGLEISAAGC
ncbi:MAG TPA: translational GTPase TypA [Spirochaetota bacterium]|nr:translational GTPase TypA [Spirochaetota bacterium]